MLPFAQQHVPVWTPAIVGIAVSLCLCVWLVVLARLGQGKRVLPYQPRRRVPWRGSDVLLVVLVFVLLSSAAQTIVVEVLGPEVTRSPMVVNTETASAEHMVTKLLKGGSVWVFLACGVSAVIIAPAVEEFFFRLVLQGWLEAEQRRWRRRVPTLHRLVPGAVDPILLTSFLFAKMHFRVESVMLQPDFLLGLMLGDSVAKVLTLLAAIGILRLRAGASAADLGWDGRRVFSDIGLGLVSFAAIVVPLFAMQFTLVSLLPKYVAPDPITLFPFAVMLGILYHRTRRLAPCIALHGALNATSLALAWLG